MKRLFTLLALGGAMFFAACGGDSTDPVDPTPTPPPGGEQTYAAPTIVLADGNIDEAQEMTPELQVKVNVAAEAGIEDLTIKIVSPFLTEDMMATVGLSTAFSLAEPGAMADALTALGFPTGADVKGKTAVSFDITTFVPMILMLYDETTDHKFALTVKDTEGQTTTKTLTLHQTKLPEAPTITLAGGDIDQPQEMTEDLQVKIDVAAAGTIADLTIRINSPFLNEEVLTTVGLATEFSLAAPGTMADALTALGFPTGDAVVGKTAVSFDITTFVPMILMLYDETADHKFTLTAIDAKGQEEVKTLTLHQTKLPEAPVISLATGDIDQPQELTNSLQVKVDIAAAGKIADLKVKIDSPFLTAEVLGAAGLATEFSLAEPGAMADALKKLNLPTGADVKGKTALTLDLTPFGPMILSLFDETADHKFLITVVDEKMQEEAKTLTLHQTEKAKAAPTIALADGNIDQPQELTENLKVKLNVTAEGKIKNLKVKIDSPTLTADMLATVNLPTEFDLANPGNLEQVFKGLNIPCGAEVKGQTEVSIDITAFVPVLLGVNVEADHKFAVTVTDEKDKSASKTLTIHQSLVLHTALAYNNDADLWANTASVKVEDLPAGAKVQYRVKGGEWIDATAAAAGTYTLAPVWETGKNLAEEAETIYTAKAGTGIYAGTTYEVRAVNGTEEIATAEFTTPAGDTLPNNTFAEWSTKKVGNATVTYPNAAGDTAFWDSGNNSYTKNLCTQNGDAGAVLKAAVANFIIIKAFAAGNLFAGEFTMSGTTGTAAFGQPYTWTARPRAIKLRVKTNVGTIDYVGSNDKSGVAKGDQDQLNFFAACVNWEARHGVKSGTGTPTGMWNPSTDKTLAEGDVIGYAQQYVSENHENWYDLIIPFQWYDTTTNPSAANYSVVISCGTSYRGDYLTGCSTNEIQVESIEWVY